MVAADTRLNIAQRDARTLPWIGTGRTVQTEHISELQRIHVFQLGGPDKHIGADDPRHALYENGGLACQWYVDDGPDLGAVLPARI